MIEAKRLRRLYDRVFGTRHNCTFQDIERLLIAVGFCERHAPGSHVSFRLGRHVVVIPISKPVKRWYVDEALRAVREVLGDG